MGETHKQFAEKQDADLVRRFAHHPPNAEKIERHARVRDLGLALARATIDLVPAGREQSVALTKLEEWMYWANAGIAREGT